MGGSRVTYINKSCGFGACGEGRGENFFGGGLLYLQKLIKTYYYGRIQQDYR